MPRACLMFAIMFVTFSSHAVGAIVAYNFSGTINSTAEVKTPFGTSIGPASTISGRFIYDTGATAVDINSMVGPTPVTTSWYRPAISGGLTFTVGGGNFSADSYQISVRNDAPQSSSIPTIVDTITIGYNNVSPLAALPTSPLRVGGVPQTSATFTITLRAPSSLLSSRALPGSLSFASFSITQLIILQDNTLFGSLVTGNLSSITVTHAPEPNSAILLTAAGATLLRLRTRRGQTTR